MMQSPERKIRSPGFLLAGFNMEFLILALMFKFHFRRDVSRAGIFLMDISVALVSVLFAYLLRFNFRIPEPEVVSLQKVVPFVLTIRVLSFLIFRPFTGIVQYTSTRDAQRIFLTCLAGSAFFSVFNIYHFSIEKIFLIPFGIVIMDFILTVFIMVSLRMLIKSLYQEFNKQGMSKTYVIIYGAGEAGYITRQTMERDASSKYKVLAFLDDDPKKIGNVLEGLKIYNAKTELEELLKQNMVAHLIISIKNLSADRKQEVVETCLKYNTKVLTVPPVSTWINGELSFKQIKKIKIDELLEREPILLSEEKISRQLSGRRVLITGGAGSIGSEMARQVMKFNPEKIILLDISESPLYDLELEFSEKLGFKKFEVVLGDIRNPDRMRNLFETFRPEIVFHSAAYKHVPMLEGNPAESVHTNVGGTKIVADLSNEYGVLTFVMISTDKAVNPSNIMGATKRIAEIYVQSLNQTSQTKFITTRFGNVLGSNGSVLPRFRKQIETGGPVTITHPEVTRFFMTIPEACQLVMEAGATGKGGEVFLFDMGKSVKVLDLAKRMIQLSGLTLDKDIKIAYTGLRPGEKLYEELLGDRENVIPTHHPKIMAAKVEAESMEKIAPSINQLLELVPTQNNELLVKKMKAIIPEFVSNNSIYERFDEKRDITVHEK